MKKEPIEGSTGDEQSERDIASELKAVNQCVTILATLPQERRIKVIRASSILLDINPTTDL